MRSVQAVPSASLRNSGRFAPLERSPINLRVTRPFLPPQETYERHLDGVWDRLWLTNEGPLAAKLAYDICAHLSLPHLQLVSSGGMALQLALAAFDIKGSAIVTPFSHVSTAHAATWLNIEPIFVDIDQTSMCLDPQLIEDAIRPDTQAILATHVYGMPCDVAQLKEIAERRGLRLIFDGAHAFGSTLSGRSLLDYGDACAASFHATKLFHCVEGGGVVSHAADINERIALMKAHGAAGDVVTARGVNAKMSELHAAMGLSNLPHVADIIRARRKIFGRYRERLSGQRIVMLEPDAIPGLEWNYAYFPIIVKDTDTALRLQAALAGESIEGRRYFFPALNTLDKATYRHCPVAEDISTRILCLPFGPWLTESDCDRVCEIAVSAL